MSNRSDAVEIAWTPPSGRRRRLVFEPRSTGGHTRIDQEFRDGEWVTTGQEIVANVDLEAPAAIMRGGSPDLGVHTFRGP